MDLKVPITLVDELTDDVINSRARLDLASGEISRIEYEDYDVQADGLPALLDDYEFTCGTLTNNGRDLEFQVQVNRTTGQYAVSANELLEIKKRAAALFGA